MMDVASGALRGLGKSFSSMIISLVGACLFRLVWIWVVFPLNPTLDVVYVSYPISWVLTFGVAFVVIVAALRKLLRNQAAPPVV